MDFGLKGKRALVLGGSRGLGAAITQALREEGVTVLAASRSGEYKVDLADPASVTALIERVKAGGGVDILVNNSGGPKAGPAQGQASTDWQAAFNAMAASLYAITDAMLPGMIDRKFGRIITVGSSGVEAPIAGLALSNAIRGAVAGWSKTLAGEVAKHGITVNMVLPGRIDTDRVRELDEGKAGRTGTSVEAVQEASRNEIPAGRYGRPEEFGAVVAFLASQQASYVTGSMLRIDGGMIKGL
ncbi:3-oxoacyl-[acyl-carrier protein] reductase [Devosia crocina]|uniref:3-oxoacyl-[acyl-carrier protein] reductase n=1 Tax=Devosia crocina TaxID=429728 RepID=A0A1I7MXR1_9HYPH|nr:SDR family oxidoreductase [Devosia crocina]SFV27201.1 3-oxoacyl-[acyl-carrier protein] reductase [Devosia crocina]